MINLGTIKENKIIRACGARKFHASVLRKRYRPDDAWSLLHGMWDHRSSYRRSQYLLLAGESDCLGNATAGLADQVLLGNLRDAVRAEKVVVYMEWLSPVDYPVKADPHDNQWWMIPRGLFKQTVMRRQALPGEIERKYKHLLDVWMPIDPYDEAETGPRLAGLMRCAWAKTSASAGREFDFTKITLPELVDWAKKAILSPDGEIALYQELAQFTMRRATESSPLTAAEYEAAAKKYAKKYDINLGEAKPEVSLEKIPKANPDDPQLYKTKTTKEPHALDNEKDETCPSHNCRSESVDSADTAVDDWFGSALGRHGNETLGADSGGGFLASTTRVVNLPKGTVLFRYFGGNSFDNGSWWTLSALEGDPRAECALYPNKDGKIGGTGAKLVKCVLNEDTNVLMGLGAPRCSNKPGGPIQVCLPYGTVGSKATLVA